MEYPYDEIFKPLRVKYDADVNYVSEFLQRMKIAHEHALYNIDKNTERTHANFNKNAELPKLKAGDRVYVLEPALKVGISRKLAKKWIGPYRILNLKGVTAEIKEIHGTKVKKIHVNRLKLCKSTNNVASRLANIPVSQQNRDRGNL